MTFCLWRCFYSQRQSLYLTKCDDLRKITEAAIWFETQTCSTKVGGNGTQRRGGKSGRCVWRGEGGGGRCATAGRRQVGPARSTLPTPPAAELSSACAAGMRLDHSGVVGASTRWGPPRAQRGGSRVVAAPGPPPTHQQAQGPNMPLSMTRLLN